MKLRSYNRGDVLAIQRTPQSRERRVLLSQNMLQTQTTWKLVLNQNAGVPHMPGHPSTTSTFSCRVRAHR